MLNLILSFNLVSIYSEVVTLGLKDLSMGFLGKFVYGLWAWPE